jgi:hypothetical protein
VFRRAAAVAAERHGGDRDAIVGFHPMNNRMM